MAFTFIHIWKVKFAFDECKFCPALSHHCAACAVAVVMCCVSTELPKLRNCRKSDFVQFSVYIFGMGYNTALTFCKNFLFVFFTALDMSEICEDSLLKFSHRMNKQWH